MRKTVLDDRSLLEHINQVASLGTKQRAPMNEMLYRHNLTLIDSNSAWLDRLSEEIRLEGEPLGDRPRCYLGASRTHRLAPDCPFPELTAKKRLGPSPAHRGCCPLRNQASA
jgi:hypothetical protein